MFDISPKTATIFILSLMMSALAHSVEVPEEARDVAEVYLEKRGLNASLGEPYPRYVMWSKDLLNLDEDGSSLLANATFVCFDFPILVKGVPKGMISVRNTGEEWEYYRSSGQEKLFGVIHDLRKKKTDSEISLLSIDSHKFFAVVASKDMFFLIPKNSLTQDLFEGTIYQNDEFPWISYSIALPILREYASGESNKGCIEHDK